MSKQRFSIAAEFTWSGEDFQVKRLLPESLVEISNLKTHESQIIAYRTLTNELLAGKLAFLFASSMPKSLPAPDMSSLNEVERQIMEFRFAVIRPLLKKKTSESVVYDRVQEVKRLQANGKMWNGPVSVSSVYRWVKAYRDSGNNRLSLVPRFFSRGGKGKSRLSKEVDFVVDSVIEELYLVRTPESATACHGEVVARIRDANQGSPQDGQLSKPSESTIVRRIRAIDVQKKMRAHHGKQVTDREYRQHDRMDYNLNPLERVEFDHTTIDLIVVDDVDSYWTGNYFVFT